MYRSYLASIYDTDYLPADEKYPLSSAKHFINLECVDVRKHFTRKELEDSWSDIVHGKLDRFPRRKILMQEIASKDEKFPKLVIIKGAPGVGKTTLSWELCRQWARGESWTDYSLVLLLRLRDESTQNAAELIDLLQCGNPTVSIGVDSIIGKKNGQGVLFILEGLDELPEALRGKDSILKKLITGRLLPASTVLVTTRPWAVCDLPYACSPRIDQFIEILGFSAKQICEYIDVMIKDGAPAELRQYVDSNPRIASSMYNPLHARIIVEVYTESYKETNSVFPNTTTEVYNMYSRVLIERHLQGIPEIDWSGELTELPSSLQPQFDKLCSIAYKGISNEKQQLVFFKDDIQDANDTLGFMNSVHPLHRSIIARNSSPSYNFLHLTLQEFLAAFYIRKNKTPQEQLILFKTKAVDGVYKMVLLFLAGLTRFQDPWTQCVLPNPRVCSQNGFKVEKTCEFTDDQILWLYESQNERVLRGYKDVLYILQLRSDHRNSNQLFALGYVLAFADFNIARLSIECDTMLFQKNAESMLLAGIDKSKSFLLRVEHLMFGIDDRYHSEKINVEYFPLIDMIVPQIRQFTLKDVNILKPTLCFERFYKIIQPSLCLSFVDLDFGSSRECIEKILDILKSKKCLRTLKCTSVSPVDEELLSEFIAHASIETLIIVIYLNPQVAEHGSFFHDRGYFSIRLCVNELRKNNLKILPPSLELPFNVQLNNDDPNFLYFVEESTLKKFTLLINHWKLSMKSLKYCLNSHKIQLYHPSFEMFYRAVLTCPLIEHLAIVFFENNVITSFFSEQRSFTKPTFLCSLTDGLRTHKSLRSLSLFYPGDACKILNSLKGNQLIKSLNLSNCSPLDTQVKIGAVDIAAGEYLETNNSLEELKLKYLPMPVSALFRGLQHNTSLKKLQLGSAPISSFKPRRMQLIACEPQGISIATMLQFNTTLRVLKCPIYYNQSPPKLLPILEALCMNKTLRHLKLFLLPKGYTLTAEETEALGNMLSKNNTLEVFHFDVEIIDCLPIVKGLLDNKTLQEFGANSKTEKNIIKCPDFVHIRRKVIVL